MAWHRRKNVRIFAVASLFAILTGTFIAASPTGSCVRSQTAILLSDAYAEVPLRALSSAQIMCQRNQNRPVPLRLAFRAR